MSEDINITTQNNTRAEQEVVGILNDITRKYNLPLYTKDVLVSEGERPHSHPMLTLNTRTKDEPSLVLKTFVHEQYHWFAQDHPQYNEAMDYLKEHYEDNGECNKNRKLS